MAKRVLHRSPAVHRTIGLLFGAICLYLAFRGVDHAELGRVLKTASIPVLAGAGCLSLLMSAIKCTKLGILLRAVHKLRYRVLFAAEMISIIVDISFPFRLQELVRAYMIGRGERIPASFVLGAEMVEKCMEFLCLLGVLFALSMCRPLPAWLTAWIGLAAAIAVLIGGFLAMIVARPELNEWATKRVGRIRIPGITRLCRLLDNMLKGIREAAVRPVSMLWVLLVTLIEWCVLAATLWVAARAVGVTLNAPQLLGVIAFNMIAFAVPTSTSGSVGIYELAGTATLVLIFGFAHEQALAVTLALHIVMVGFGALGGLVGLQMAHVTLGQVRREADSTRHESG